MFHNDNRWLIIHCSIFFDVFSGKITQYKVLGYLSTYEGMLNTDVVHDAQICQRHKNIMPLRWGPSNNVSSCRLLGNSQPQSKSEI